MLRRFVKDSAVYGAGSVISRAVPLLLIPLYTRFLGVAEVGAVELLAVIGAFTLLLLGLEITQAVARQLALGGDRSNANRLASTAFWYTVMVFSVFLVLALLLAPVVTPLVFGDTVGPTLLRAAAAFFAANAVLQFCLNQLRWELRPWAYVRASVVTAVLSAAGTILLIGFFDSGVAGIYYAHCLGAVAGIAIAFSAMPGSISWSFDLKAAGAMLRFSAPLAVSGVAMMTATLLDRVVVGALLGLSDLGVYGIAARFASIIAVVIAGFQATVIPLVTSRAADPSTPRDLARMFRAFLALVLPIALAIACLAPEMLLLFTTRAFYGGAPLVPLLVMGVLLAGVYPFAPGLWIAGRTWLVLAANLLVAAVSLVLNFALAYAAGLVGAALAALLVGLIAFGLNFRLSQRHYLVPFPWRPILSALLISVAATLVLSAAFAMGEVTWSPFSLFFRLLLLAALTAALLRILLTPSDRSLLRAPANFFRALR